MTPPPGVSNTLDLAIDPQLVHDLSKAFHVGVGKQRAKVLRSVPEIRFHSREDEAGVFAQRMHGDVPVITATLSMNMRARVSPPLSGMTAAWAFWSAGRCGPLQSEDAFVA